MSDGRYWARRSQHERMRPTEENVEKIRTKAGVNVQCKRSSRPSSMRPSLARSRTIVLDSKAAHVSRWAIFLRKYSLTLLGEKRYTTMSAEMSK
jgi:hypothetical protein